MRCITAVLKGEGESEQKEGGERVCVVMPSRLSSLTEFRAETIAPSFQSVAF